MERTQLSAAFKALLAALLFGISAPLAKVLLGNMDPIPLAAFLYLGSGLSMGLVYVLQNNRAKDSMVEARLERSEWPWLLGAILAGGIAAPILLLVSLRATPAATAALLLNFEGVATSLIAVLAFREAISRRIWISIGLVMLASVLLSWEPDANWGFSLGALGVVGACFLWGMDNNFTRNISDKDPVLTVAVKGTIAGLVSLLLAVLAGQSWPDLHSLLGALLLGSLSYGLSIVLYILSMRDLGAARTSAYFGAAPFMGAAVSFVIFSQTPDIRFLFAFTLMAAGAFFLTREQHGHWHSHSAMTHEHRHRHDDGHHQHEHSGMANVDSQAHSHVHVHAQQTHLHDHTPDSHHRHDH